MYDLSFLRTLFSPFSGFPLFTRRGIPVLQHELGCHTISVFDILCKFFLKKLRIWASTESFLELSKFECS